MSNKMKGMKAMPSAWAMMAANPKHADEQMGEIGQPAKKTPPMGAPALPPFPKDASPKMAGKSSPSAMLGKLHKMERGNKFGA